MIPIESRVFPASIVPNIASKPRGSKPFRHIMKTRSSDVTSAPRSSSQVINYDVAAMIVTQVGCHDIHVELWLNIHKLYTLNDYRSLCALSRVNSFFGSVAHSFIYRDVTLDFRNSAALQAVRLLQRLRKVRKQNELCKLPSFRLMFLLLATVFLPCERILLIMNSDDSKRLRKWDQYCLSSRSLPSLCLAKTQPTHARESAISRHCALESSAL